MERKKRREKPAINGNIADGTSGQSGDANSWQREAEQQQCIAKKLVSTSTSESPSQHYSLLMNWSFPQHPTAAQQQSANTIMRQPHGGQPLQQQVAAPMQGPLQGGLQAVSPSPCRNPDGSGQSIGPIQAPPQSGAVESGWPQATGAPNMGPRPPPFVFPPLPYSGTWDPSSWWGHNPYPPPFPHMYPGCGSWYPYPIPPTLPIGGNQRGCIKPPPGLSQKHHRVWEAQSMENMQLWTTTTQLWAAVARADAEIALQRTRILKLEADLQMVKGHQDGNTPRAEDMTATLPLGGHRGRRKKATAASPDITAAGTPAPDALQTPGKKARQIIDKADSSLNLKQMELEEKEKYPRGNHASEAVYRPPVDDRDQKCCSPTVGSLRNQSMMQKHSLRQTLEFQSPTNSSINSSVTVARDELAFSHSTHINSPFKPSSSSLLGGRKVSYEHSLKEIAAVSFLKNGGNGLDHSGVIAGEIPYCASLSSGGMCPDSNGRMMAKDAVVRSQLQAQFNMENMEKVHPLSIPKPNPSWQYTVEDGSDEQDKGGASIQDDDDDDDMDDEDEEAALEEIHNDKVGNLWHSVPFR